MNHRLQHLESVSCSCGHGYCVFCIKAYLDKQKERESFPQSEVDWLIETQFQPSDALDSIQEHKHDIGASIAELCLDTLGLQRSRPSSQRSSQRRKSSLALRNSLPLEDVPQVIPPDFSTRDEFLQYAQEVSLDLDTAFKNLVLSEGNRRVTNVGRSQRYLTSPERFSFFWQVLSSDSLTQRSYVELEWAGPWVYVAVVDQTIQRYGDGRECGLGGNELSWALHCRRGGGSSFWHNAVSTRVEQPVEEGKVGLYLDQEAGVLTFYSVQDENMLPLHRVKAQFSQQLHIGLWLAVDASAVFSKLK